MKKPNHIRHQIIRQLAEANIKIMELEAQLQAARAIIETLIRERAERTITCPQEPHTKTSKAKKSNAYVLNVEKPTLSL